MDNQKPNPAGITPQDAMRLASSPDGQKLLSLLQQSGGDDLRSAIQMASAGDYTQARQAAAALLQNPEIRKLLEKMGR